MRIESSERDNWLARARSWRVAGVSLVLLCLAVYVPGLTTLPPVDRDESRFAQASRQMFESAALPTERLDPALHSGGLAIPMVQDRPRLNKPPLIYWLQSASAAAFTAGDPLRDAIWMYRIPSLLAAIASVLITWRMGVRMFDPRAGWLAGALLAVCPIVIWESRQARADMVLLAATTGAMAALYAIWRSRKRSILTPLMLWAAVGAGVMVKGPITPMVVILTALAASLVGRRWRWLARTRPLLGLLVVGACVAPWVIAVANHVGFDEYWAIVRRETIGRSAEAQEGHWGPPGYHLVLLCVLFWPGTLVTALAVRRAIGIARRPRVELDAARRRPELFLLAWVVPSWIVFELVSTKLPHYTLPLYPAVALLSARGVFAAATGRLAGVSELLTRIGFGVWLAIGAGVSLATAFAVLAPHRGSTEVVVIAGAVLAVVFGVALFELKKALDRRDFAAVQLRSIIFAAFIGVCLVGLAFPNIRDLWISPRIVETVSKHYTGDRPLAAIDFHEDSLIFATRGRVARIDAQHAAEWLRANPRGVIVAPPGAIDDRFLKLARLRTWNDGKGAFELEGFNYSQGERVVLEFVELEEQSGAGGAGGTGEAGGAGVGP